jgi:sialate O-acetylesterase
MLKLSTLLSICLVFFSGFAFCDIKLPPVINNNMVLQQQSRVALWGDANVNTEVKVNTTRPGQTRMENGK